MGIFSDHAARYWAAGLPAIPLIRGQKRPAIEKWQTFANQMPSDEEQALWLEDYGNGNIGLPLGPKSGLIAIDIDVDDPKILGVLNQVLPLSPWTRIGAKGKVMIYRYNGQPSIRIKHLQDGKLESVVEMLSAGTQIVLPPSIHPTTQKPYTANADLVEVLDKVQNLPPNMEAILRDALREVGINVASSNLGALTSFVSPGSRDNTMMSIAGLFASDVCRGQKTLLQACEEIEAWALNFTKQVYGDSLDPSKGPKKVVECLIKDVTGPKHKTLPKGWDEGLSDEQKEKMGLSIFTVDHETWDFSKIKAYFDAGLEKIGVKDNPELFLNHVRDVIFKIAANKGLDNLEEGRLVRHMSDISGKTVSIIEIRRMIQEYRSGEIKGTDQTEIAEAVKKDLEETKGEVRYHNEKLWHWGGSHWKELDEGEISKHIAKEYGSFRAASKSGDHRGILSILKNISKKALKCKDENGINFVNGFLTEDLTLKEHDPDHGMTYCLAYPYTPSEAGKCTKWLTMLHDYWGMDADYADKVNALGEAIAVTMFGKAPECQQAFCLYGVSHSGKSRILEIIQLLMPPEAQGSMPPTMWGDKFGTAPLADKLLNYAGELSEYQLIDSTKSKQVIEGAMIDAQYKNGQIFNFRPKAAHWFASNHLPKTRDSSDGFTRRWLFFHFPRKFPANRRIADYHKQVAAEERVAIAAWAVQYIVRLRNANMRLTDPPSSIALRTQLENELNSVQAFLSDFQDQGRMRLGVEENKGIPNPTTHLDILWTEYRSYCVSAGVSPVKSKTFVQRMSNLQGTFGFLEVMEKNAQGFQVILYKYVTLAAKRAT